MASLRFGQVAAPMVPQARGETCTGPILASKISLVGRRRGFLQWEQRHRLCGRGILAGLKVVGGIAVIAQTIDFILCSTSYPPRLQQA